MAVYDKRVLDGEHLKYLLGKIKTAIRAKIDNPSSKSDGQFLKYNSSTDKWIAADVPDTGVLSVSAKDTTINVDNTDSANPEISVGTITLSKVSDAGTAAAKDYVAAVTRDSTDLVTSGAVFNAISGLTGFHFIIVQVLPTTDIETNAIYLVPKTQTETGNVYTEYAYISNTWEILGDTKVNIETLTNGDIDNIWNSVFS